MTSAQGDWLTIGEACDVLRVTKATLYRWARQGRLRLYKLGSRATRIKRSELDRMLSPKDDTEAWTALSEASFAEDWNNDDDAVYDNWRVLYGVHKR